MALPWGCRARRRPGRRRSGRCGGCAVRPRTPGRSRRSRGVVGKKQLLQAMKPAAIGAPSAAVMTSAMPTSPSSPAPEDASGARRRCPWTSLIPLPSPVAGVAAAAGVASRAAVPEQASSRCGRRRLHRRFRACRPPRPATGRSPPAMASPGLVVTAQAGAGPGQRAGAAQPRRTPSWSQHLDRFGAPPARPCRQTGQIFPLAFGFGGRSAPISVIQRLHGRSLGPAAPAQGVQRSGSA